MQDEIKNRWDYDDIVARRHMRPGIVIDIPAQGKNIGAVTKDKRRTKRRAGASKSGTRFSTRTFDEEVHPPRAFDSDIQRG